MVRSEHPKNSTPTGDGEIAKKELSASDLRALAELGGVFASDRNLNDSLSWLDSHVKPLISHDRFVVDILSGDRSRITSIYVSGTGRSRLLQGESDSVEGSLAANTALTGEVFIATSVDASVVERFPATSYTVDNGIKSWMSIPLISDGYSFGSASFLSHTDGAFSDRHLQLAEIVSTHVASAVNTTRLVEQLKDESTSLQRDQVRDSAIREIGLTIASTLNIEDAFEDFSDLVRMLIPAEYISVIRIRENDTTIRDPFIAGDIVRRDPVDLDSSIAGLLAREMTSFLANLETAKQQEEMIAAMPATEFDVNHGFRSILSVPLLAGDTCVGAIHLRDSSVGKFTREHVEIAEQIATYVAPAVVNADLHFEIQRESEIQEVLVKTSRLMSSTVSIGEIMPGLRELVNSILPADRLVVSLIDESTNTILDSYMDGVPMPDQALITGFKSRSAGSIRTAVERTVSVMPTEEIDSATEESDRGAFLTRQAGLRSAMYAPLVSDGQLIGTINVKSSWPHAYGESEQATFGQIAQQIVGSIAAAEYALALQSEFEVQEVLAELSRTIASASSLDEVFDDICKLLGTIVPIDRLVIALEQEDTGQVRDSHVFGVPVPGWDDSSDERPRGTAPAAAAKNLELVITPTKVLDEVSLEKDGGIYYSKAAGLRSAIYAPLIAEGRLIGTLNAKSKSPDAYGIREQSVFELIAQQLASSLGTSIYSQALQTEVQRQESLADLGRVITASKDLSSAFDEISTVISRIVPIDTLFISTLVPETDLARIRLIWGDASPQVRIGTDYPVEHSQVELVLKSGEPLHIGERNIDELARTIPRLVIDIDHGLRSQITVPLVSNGKTIGILGVRSLTTNAYTSQHVALTSLIAGHIAGAVEKDELTFQSLQVSKENEVLAEIGRLMSSSVDLGEVIEEFDSLLKSVIPHDRMVIALLEDDDRYLVDHYLVGQALPAWDARPRRRVDEFQAWSEKDNWFTFSASMTDESSPNWRPGFRHATQVGLVRGVTSSIIADNHLIGTISIKSADPNAFTDREIRLYERITRQISGSVAASELSRALRTEAAEQENLAELGRVMDASNDLDEVWPDASAILGRMIKSDRISLAYKNEFDKDRIQIRTHGTELPMSLFDFSLPIYGELWDSPRLPFILENSDYQQSKTAREVEEVTHAAGLVSTLFAPVVRREKVVALLTFRSKTEEAFSRSDVRLAGMLANQISGAVVNSQSFRAIEQAAENRDALSELGRILSQSLDLEEQFEQLGTQIQKLIQVDRLTLAYLTDDDQYLDLRYIFGVQLADLPAGGKLSLPPGAAEVLLGLRDHLLVDEENCKQYPWLEPVRLGTIERGFPTLLFCPVVWQDEVIALLTFRSSKENAYDDAGLQIATLIANRIAGSVASLDAYQATKRESEVRQALADISVMASQDLNLESAGRRIAEGIRSLLSFDRFSIATFVPESQHRILEYFEGVSLGDDYFGKDLGKLEIASDWSWDDFLAVDPRWSERDDLLRAFCLNSIIAMPIGVEQSMPSGFITIWSEQSDAYGPDERELFRQIAIHITPAVQNAKFYEQSTQLTKQREQSMELDQENKELQRIADARSEFLSTVSHELRTPLTAISAFADILHRNGSGNLSTRQIDQLEVVRRSSSNLAELIDDLLDVSRADGGNLQVEFLPFNFSEMLDEFVVGARSMTDEKRQSFVINTPENPIWLDADRSRLLQILNNLVSNASKYSPEQTTVTINVSTNRDELAVEVQDSGIGISNDDLKHVFEPFFRSKSVATRQELGTGLGLSVVKSLVELHSGSIDVSSELDGFTTVVMKIPRIIQPG